MSRTMRHWLGLSIIISAGLAGCADSPLGSANQGGLPGTGTASRRAPDLGSCDIAAPAGTRLVTRLYAEGDQIYRWSGAAWVSVAPSATLHADPARNSTVGTHYAGPTWESLSGSKVVGAVAKRCTPDATAIQWLLLNAVSSEGPGIFDGVVNIQRINTVGGIAPSAPGITVGELANVPYSTEYLFYRAE